MGLFRRREEASLRVPRTPPSDGPSSEEARNLRGGAERAWAEDGTRLRMLRRTFRREAHALTEEPSLLPAHLHNALSLDWGAVTAAAALLTGAWEAADDRPWLRLQNHPRVDREFLLSVLEHGGTVWGIAWSPRGDLLASAGSDGMVRLWDAGTGNSVAQIRTGAGQANAVAWSPDGAELASGHDDGAVRIWDAETMAARASLQVAPAGVLSLAWSPDGDCLAVGAARGPVIVLEGSQRYIRRVGKHEGEVHTLAWSPDGSVLASGGSDALVRLWQRRGGFALRAALEDRALLEKLSSLLPGNGAMGALRFQASILALAWSPDGSSLASGSRSGVVRLWDPTNERPGDLILGDWSNGAGIWSVAWSSDRSLLALGVGAGQIILGDPERRQQAQMPMGHADAVRALSFGPDGRVLASCGDDGTVRLWDARGLWERAPTMPDPVGGGHSAIISRLAWSGDGQSLVAGDRNCTACFWDAEAGTRLGSPERLDGPVLAMCPAERGVLFAASMGSQETPVTRWAGPQAKPTILARVQTTAVTALALSPDRRTLASGDVAGTVWLTRISDGTMCGVFLIEKALRVRPKGLVPVWGLAWSPDARFVAAAGRMGLIVWNARSGTEAQTVLRRPGLGGENRDVAATMGFGDQAAALAIEDHPVAWSPDGTLLASSCGERAIRLWKPMTGEPLSVLEGHRGTVTALDWSADGTLLASAGDDATVRVWDVGSGGCVALAHCLSSVRAVRFAGRPMVLHAADDGRATGLRPVPYAFEVRYAGSGDVARRPAPTLDHSGG